MAIPTPIERSLEQSGIIRQMAIDLSDDAEDRAAIIEVLRSKLYSDKVLAPIREYSTNAMDSHVEAGCPHIPIKVTLPTAIFPEFRIRDFGIGLTPDEIDKIYIKYGRSTKRNTNGQTGQLGLGCKSAFAYGDNFIVISHKDGVKTTYNLTVNGVCSTVAAEPMDSNDKNGMEIVVPVKGSDVRDFQSKAINFFKYWKICPDITGGDVGKIESLREELATKPLFSDVDWEIRPTYDSYYNSDKGIAVMGNVPYPLNWDIIASKMDLRHNDKSEILYNFVRYNRTILRFNIGDLDFSASRESLEYTDKTCKAVVAKIQSILDSIFKILDAKIQSAPSYWEALMIYNQIFGRDDEKLFQGDIHRLEGYYKGKFSWGGTPIQSGAFEHLEKWDQILGYSETGTWKNAANMDVRGSNPVLTVYENKNNRVKQYIPNDYKNNRISASKKIRIIIHDLDKPVLTKAAVRYIFSSQNLNDRANRVYMLRFGNKAQKDEFFKQMNFDSAPVIYVSDIQLKVKEWLKQGRIASAGSAGVGVRDPQTVRCFKPGDVRNKYGYHNDVEWLREDVDIREEEGYYVELDGNDAKICGRSTYNLSGLVHHSNTLFAALGESVERVYGIPDRNRNAKWFAAALKDEQWTKLDDYFKASGERILYGKGALIAKAAKFFKIDGARGSIGINFAAQILPLLTNKNGDMYKACSEVTPSYRNASDIIEALNYFGMSDILENECATDFEGLFKTVFKTYPMLDMLDGINKIYSNSKDESFSKEWLNNVANYINMVDNLPHNRLAKKI